MAVNTRRLNSIQQARTRRSTMPRYLQLDGGRYLLCLAGMICLMAVLTLWQTSVVATRGYEIARLEQQLINLNREHSHLQAAHAASVNLATVRARAMELGLRPLTSDQIRYITVIEEPVQSIVPLPPDQPRRQE